MVDITPKVQRSDRTLHERGPHGSKRRPEDLTRPSHVRVKATDEKYRRVLRHGVTKKGFMPDINQSVEWPFDSYTRRCINDGSIEIVEEIVAATAAAPQRPQEPQQQPPKQQKPTPLAKE